MGRYQQRKAQGVKITNHRIERPKSTPLLLSTKNQARQASRFRNRVTECTVEGGETDVGWCQGAEGLPDMSNYPLERR